MLNQRSVSRDRGDWIAVLEASYSLAGDDQQWLSRLLESVAREHWPEQISAAFIFDLSRSNVTVRDVAVHGPPEIHQAIHTLMSGSSAEVVDKLFRSTAVGTVSERVFAAHPDQEAFFHDNNGGTASDILGVVAHSGSGGRGVVLNLALDVPRRSKPVERRRWTRCAAHIGAGLRLRTMIPQLAALDAAPVEAILDGAGKLHDARDAAAGRTARELLRSAVLRVDRARSINGRRDPDGALEEWRRSSMVAGRWSTDSTATGAGSS